MGFKLFLLFEKFLMILPRWLRKGFFTTAASLGYFVSKKYREVGFINLDFVFGDKLSFEQKKQIVKYSFRNLLLNFLQLLELRHMSKDDICNIVHINNKEILDNIKAQNRAIVFVTIHYGNWELGGVSTGVLSDDGITAVYKEMDNKNFEQWTIDARASFGNSSVEKKGALKALVKLAKEKKSCAILIDTALNAKDGVMVEFLGKNVYQSPVPAYLARKFDAAIIPGVMFSEDEKHYELMIYDEIKVDKSDDEKADIQKATQAQANWMSSIILEQPKYWFWIHRRFKSEYKEIYKRINR